MQVFLAVLVLAAGCFADEVFEVVDSLGGPSINDFSARSDFQEFNVPENVESEFAPPVEFEYAPPVVTYAPPVVTYAPRRTAPPVTYAPPRTLPPVTYAPPKPVYGEPPATVEFAPAPEVSEPFSAPPRFDLTVVDSIPTDSFRTLHKDHFVGRPLRAGSHEYVSPDGVPVSIKFH